MPRVRALEHRYGAELHEPPVLDRRERALASLARRQHGVVSRSQLSHIGYGRHGIGRRISQGRLHLLHRGVYAVIRITWRRLEREPKALARMLRSLISSTSTPG